MNTNRISGPSFPILSAKSSIQKKKKAIKNLQELRFALHAERTQLVRHLSHFLHACWCSHYRHLCGNYGK